MKYFVKRLILFACVVPLVFIFCALLGVALPNGENGGGKGRHQVQMVSVPIHYDILLPANEHTKEAFAFLKTAGVPIDQKNVRWIILGWSAKGFYIETKEFSDMRAGTVVRAIIGDDAVMRFAAVGPLPEMEFDTLSLNDDEFHLLVDNILASLKSRDPIPGAGYTSSDAFFHANGRFNILSTCNVWVSNLFAQSGLAFGLWTPIPLSVSLSLAIYQDT